MNTIDAIETRRSIRSFRDMPVPLETIKAVIAAAMYAPSAGDEQPWHFIVVSQKDILDSIPEINPQAGMCRRAPAAILICADLTLEKYPGFWVQDCSAAAENLLLAAHDKGLGAVWTGIYPIEERVQGFRGLFNLPENVIPFALIPIGYPDQQPPMKNRYREDRIHCNSW